MSLSDPVSSIFSSKNSVSQRAGAYRTNLSGALTYQSFIPSPLPPDPPLEMDDSFLRQLIQTKEAIASLDQVSVRIPDLDYFISSYVYKEALISSQIEGTQATLEDIFDPDREELENLNVTDVVNYIRALHYAIDQLSNLPLCNRMLRRTHGILLEGVRGENKEPGSFRTSQNWLGGQGGNLHTARYIPPNPADMEKAMGDLEAYIHQEDGMDPLLKAGLLHYQFETIHPFLDGNGRIGRMLITLYWLQAGIIQRPALYLSYFLKANQLEYYDRLTEVRTKGAFEAWLVFFLKATEIGAKDALHTIDALMALLARAQSFTDGLGKAGKNVGRVLTYLESHPIIAIAKTAEDLNLSYNTVAKAVDRLIDAGFLQQGGRGKRNRIFAYEPYLAILRPGTVA